MDIGELIMRQESIKAISKSNAESYPGDLMPPQPQQSGDGMAPKEGPGLDGRVGGSFNFNSGGGFQFQAQGVDDIYRPFFAGSDTLDIMGLLENLGPGKLDACGFSEFVPKGDSKLKVPAIGKELNAAEGLGVIGRQQGG
jgi:hypothetical protein